MRARVFLIAALVLGVAIGVGGNRFFVGTDARLIASGECGNVYGFINPWLRCEPENNIQKKAEFTDFKRELNEVIDAWIAEGRVASISVYLRDLQFGPWTGINEQETFSAASLLKLPIMFALLKEAQNHPEILQQEVQVAEDSVDYRQEFAPDRRVLPGEIYTIEELLEYMLIYSDNDAKTAIDTYLEVLHPDDLMLFHTMEELGLSSVYASQSDGLTVKQISSLFRILYNASYLNKEMSQKALEILRRSDFHDGLLAGLPGDIAVAHKFGEREYDDGGRQLHDCGIVYYSKNHYLLCVMTRGRDTVEQASVIADISRLVYDEMVARNTAK